MNTLKKLVFAAGLLVALLLVAKGAGAQQVNIKSFNGNSVSEKLTAAAALTSAGGGCVSGLTCILIIPPELSVYATGTLPTMGAAQMAISYLDPAAVNVIAAGSSTLTPLGSSFTGGTLTSKVVFADGSGTSCLAANLAWSLTTELNTGWLRGATGQSYICVNGTLMVGYQPAAAMVQLQPGTCLGWAGSPGANNGTDSELCRDGATDTVAQKRSTNAQTFRVYGSTTGPAYASFSANTAACTGAAASVGVFCWDSSLNKWRYSENNGAFANAFTAANTPDWSGFCNGTASAGSTLALFGMGGGAAGSSACTSAFSDNRTHVMTAAGTITKLYVKCGTAGVNASSGVFTVMKNNSAQTVTLTLGTTTSGNDVAHSFAYVAGDTIGIQFTTQAAETLADCRASIQ